MKSHNPHGVEVLMERKAERLGENRGYPGEMEDNHQEEGDRRECRWEENTASIEQDTKQLFSSHGRGYQEAPMTTIEEKSKQEQNTPVYIEPQQKCKDVYPQLEIINNLLSRNLKKYSCNQNEDRCQQNQ